MKLTVNNIDYINEFHFKSGKITVAVMMKSHDISDARFYECMYDLVGIPVTVLKFMSTHKKEMIKTSPIDGFTEYQYK